MGGRGCRPVVDSHYGKKGKSEWRAVGRTLVRNGGRQRSGHASGGSPARARATGGRPSSPRADAVRNVRARTGEPRTERPALVLPPGDAGPDCEGGGEYCRGAIDEDANSGGGTGVPRQPEAACKGEALSKRVARKQAFLDV